MTNRRPSSVPSGQQATLNSTSEGASYTFGYSTVGGVSKGASAQRAEEALRRQGAPGGEAAAEGGPQHEAEHHACHAASCEHLERAEERVRRRPYQRGPRGQGQRTHVRNARLNDEELARITAGAKAAGMTVAGFLAHCALAAARDLERTAADVASEREVISELFAARRHLGYIGNNLNQVTKALNSGANAPHTEVVLQAVRRAVQRVEAAAQQLIDR
ncbi:plasmid mobilization relaxosome protein MobC [Streptomyces sp. NPDC001407]|uniref:plasmid mobilization protein n=1 Tax=Streptomyces sp. NPDC001407 TaxID=3364573 RepID=UPI0036AC66EE